MNTIILAGQALSPSKIICVGRNYVEHIQELNNEVPEQPAIFLKPNSAISDNLFVGDNEPVHYEGELCFLIQAGKLQAVGFGLDLTKRKLQNYLKEKGLPWERSKAFDGSAVFSQFVAFDGDCSELRMELWINQQLIQQGAYSLMMNKPQELLRDIKSFMSLEDGDVMMTGTLKGVGVVQAGDQFLAKVFQGENLLLEQHWLAQ